jgi:hypothetical protein
MTPCWRRVLTGPGAPRNGSVQQPPNPKHTSSGNPAPRGRSVHDLVAKRGHRAARALPFILGAYVVALNASLGRPLWIDEFSHFAFAAEPTTSAAWHRFLAGPKIRPRPDESSPPPAFGPTGPSIDAWNDRLVALANRNIVCGGPVWPVFRTY